MFSILTPHTISISDLKKNPMKASTHDAICVLNRGKPAFYCVSPEKMTELLSHKFMVNSQELLDMLRDGVDSAETMLNMRKKYKPEAEYFHVDASEKNMFQMYTANEPKLEPFYSFKALEQAILEHKE